MQVPIQIHFHGLDHSDAVEAYLKGRIAGLEEQYDGIVACRVAVEVEDARHREGRHYRIRVDLTVPGKELVVSRVPSGAAHADPYAAIDDAFDDMSRVLGDYVERMRGAVKSHVRD